MTATTATTRKPRCRYMDRLQNRCSGEVVEEGAEIELCTRHLAAAWKFLQRRAAAVMPR